MIKLTNREQQVYELLKQGYNSKEIAEKLKVAVNTIKNFEVKIYKKTGLKGRIELLADTVKKKLKKSIDKKL